MFVWAVDSYKVFLRDLLVGFTCLLDDPFYQIVHIRHVVDESLALPNELDAFLQVAVHCGFNKLVCGCSK